MTIRRSFTAVTGALCLACVAHASPIQITYDMIADVEINGVMHHQARTVAAMKGLTTDLVETPSTAGPGFTLPVGIELSVEGAEDFFLYTEVVAFAHPEFGYLGLRTTPNRLVFAFISYEAVGFALDRDWGPAELGPGGGTPTTILHISTGVLSFHAIHAATLRAEAMPAPGVAPTLAVFALGAAARRRRAPTRPVTRTPA